MRKQFDLVPIFYKRNPKKTRNSLAQSIHSIHYMNEMSQKRDQSIQEEQYEDGDASFRSRPKANSGIFGYPILMARAASHMGNYSTSNNNDYEESFS